LGLIELLFAATAFVARSGAAIQQVGSVFMRGFVAATNVASVDQDTDNRSLSVGATWLCRVRSRL
jgi:hypothetical protein